MFRRHCRDEWSRRISVSDTGQAERTHVVVNSCNNDGADHHQPIRHGNVDLTVEFLACINHFDMWKVG